MEARQVVNFQCRRRRPLNSTEFFLRENSMFEDKKNYTIFHSIRSNNLRLTCKVKILKIKCIEVKIKWLSSSFS